MSWWRQCDVTQIMMFPRKNSVARSAVLIGVFFVCGWVWISTPVTPPGDILPNFMSMPHSLGGDTRGHTPRFVPPEAKHKGVQSHHHSNDTLEEMRKNMTILKNGSGLGSILNTFNKTKSNSKSVILDKHQHQVIKYANPHPFAYLINTERVCRNQDVFVIAYIHTAPSHYKRRMIIRETWGNPKYFDVTVRVVFIMGETNDKPEVQQALLFEAEQYGDIVQEDFQDTYKNLTYKGIGALKWISKYCPHAKFVLKSDDDIFVNMFTLLRHLKSMDKLGVENKGLLMCLVWYRMKVMREGKWKISEEMWKDPYYPTYCSGSAFTMSIDVAIALHNISYHVPFFWVDDFYITGLLPLKLGKAVKHKQFMSTYVLDGRKLQEKFTGPQWFTYIFSHVHDLNAIQSVWKRILDLNQGKTVPTVKYALPGQLPKEEPKPNKG